MTVSTTIPGPPHRVARALRGRIWELAVFSISLAVFLLSPVRQFSDSSYSLLVSECLYKHGTFTLDRYIELPLDPGRYPGATGNGLPYHIVSSGGHYYYFFPPGSSVLSIPMVVIANICGMSAISPDGSYDFQGERQIQKRVAALLMAWFTLVVFRMCRLVLATGTSLIFSFCAALTTPVWSTASRSLWSHSWAIVLVMLAIHHLVRHELLGRRPRPILLGTLMGLAYLTRPTMAIGVAVIGVYLAFRWRRTMVAYGSTIAGWCAVLVAYSWIHFGRLLPPYFSVMRLGFPDLRIALPAYLVSPSRGLLVFVPHLLVVSYLIVRYRRRSALVGFDILAGLALAGHLIVVSSFPHWWGGHGYGPRLLTDTVPWLVLAALVAVDAWLTQRSASSRRRFRLEAATLWILLAASAFVHGVGAISPAANQWNWEPVNVDADPTRVWDWHDPQFLAPWTPRPRQVNPQNRP